MQDDLRPAPWWEGQPTWLWKPTTYHLTRFVILRLLGFVYFFAFLGLAHQVLPLMGSHGLTPVGPHLDQLRAIHQIAPKIGGDGFGDLPSIFWWAHGDQTLVGLAWVGVFLSALVMCGFANMPIMLALWILYGSFVRVGDSWWYLSADGNWQDAASWFSFGWEIQILETGLIAAFLCPPLDPRPFPERPPTFTSILLMRWLTFRIMLGAGLIKIRGHGCWGLSELRCLDWHFETQPLPNPVSPLYHAAPHWFHAAGVLYNHLCELILPWFVFGPRLFRLIAGVCMVFFQLTLISSGNLAFLNWLTLIPVLACLDDDFLMRVLPRRLRAAFERARPGFARRPHLAQRILTWAFAAIVAYLSLTVVDNLREVGRFARQYDAHGRHIRGGQVMNSSFDRFDAVGTYGAFGTVGDTRYELIFEGTRDEDPNSARWTPYEFPCKPGDVDRRPCVLGPYHHRLDWLLWFAAMYQPDDEPWAIHLVWKLLHADPLARSLLARDPFGDDPPRWIRIERYKYQFAPLGDRAWWTRTLVDEWMPPTSIDDDWLVEFLEQHGWPATYERPSEDP